MKFFHLVCILSISIFTDQIANESPDLPQSLQLESGPEPQRCYSADCAAKTCVTCCWIAAWIPTTATCLLNDISCGVLCCKPPCSDTFRNNDMLACSDHCPPYCIPNTRHGLQALLECKPTIMK